MSVFRVYERTPYVAMRMVPAILGIATIPLSYITLRGLDCRATTALLASLLITFENGMITQSRHILLDSPLIFFTALTVFTWTGFCNEDKHEPFTERWWVWLTLTGLSLGAVVSSKWVGLFTIATVGLGGLRIPVRDDQVHPRRKVDGLKGLAISTESTQHQDFACSACRRLAGWPRRQTRHLA